MDSSRYQPSQQVGRLKNHDTCAMCGATRLSHPERKFFRFPRNSEMCSKWITACNKPHLGTKKELELHQNYRLCSAHFTEEDFSTELKHRLKSTAYPSKNFFDEKVVKKRKIDLVSWQSTLAAKLSPVAVSSYEECFQPHLTTSTPLHKDDDEFCSQSQPVSAYPCTPKRSIKNRFITPKTKKIKVLSTKLHYLSRKLFSQQNEKKISTALMAIKHIVPSALYTFIAGQVKLINIPPRDRRWTSRQKNLALKLYLSSPKTYDTLRKLFAFPSKKTLLKSVSGIAVEPGFSETFLTALKTVADKMEYQSKLCVVMFDEIKLKAGLTYNEKLDLIVGYENYGPYREEIVIPKYATHALVFMARGICSKWKQVFATFFTADTASADMINILVPEAVRKLRQANLIPKAIICDQGANNQCFIYTKLGIDESRPYFNVDEQKVYAIFDPPHLLKCLRNNFKRYDVKFENHKVASWEHIVQFYEFDKKMTHRVAPKLTRKHIEVDGLSAMNVRLAAQVFSHSVVTGLCYLTACERLPSRANFTADFCEKVNNVFDSINSRVRLHKKELLSAVTKTSSHKNVWKQFTNLIKSMSFDTKGKKIKFPCLRGWLITLSSFDMLTHELLHEEQVDFVMMSRFNQDPLESFFAQIRRRGGNNDHPTANDFMYRMRMLLADGIIRTYENANCERDQDGVLIPVDLINEKKNTSFSDKSLIIDESFYDDDIGHSDESSDAEITDIFSENSAAYVAGYVARKMLKNFQCDECQKLLTAPKEMTNSTIFLYFKEFENTKGGLVYPSSSLISIICKFGNLFTELFYQNCYKQCIKTIIVKHLLQIAHNEIQCTVHKELWSNLVYIYVKMMLHLKVKFLSKEFRNRKQVCKKLNKL